MFHASGEVQAGALHNYSRHAREVHAGVRNQHNRARTRVDNARQVVVRGQHGRQHFRRWFASAFGSRKVEHKINLWIIDHDFE